MVVLIIYRKNNTHKIPYSTMAVTNYSIRNVEIHHMTNINKKLIAAAIESIIPGCHHKPIIASTKYTLSR